MQSKQQLLELTQDPSRRALIALMGAPGSGKSSFAETALADLATAGSDECRLIISGDAGDQSVSKQAFMLVDSLFNLCNPWQRLICIDSTAASPFARKQLEEKAHFSGRELVYLAFTTPLEETLRRNAARERVVPEEVVARMHAQVTEFLDHSANLRHMTIPLGPEVLEDFPGGRLKIVGGLDLPEDIDPLSAGRIFQGLAGRADGEQRLKDWGAKDPDALALTQGLWSELFSISHTQGRRLPTLTDLRNSSTAIGPQRGVSRGPERSLDRH